MVAGLCTTRPVRIAASSRLGVTSAARGNRSSRITSSASVVSRPGAGGGDHDRIDYQGGPAVFPDGPGHQANQARLGQHPGLERGRRQVLRQGNELCANHGFGHRLHGADPERYSAR